MQTAASGLPPPRVPGAGKRPSGGHIGGKGGGGAPPEGGHFGKHPPPVPKLTIHNFDPPTPQLGPGVRPNC